MMWSPFGSGAMKTPAVLLVLLPTLVLAGLSAAKAQVLQPNDLCSDQPASAIATFSDANLEAAVRAALTVGAEADLTCGLVSGLTELHAPDAGIGSLVGIQNLTSLTGWLDLRGNSISDVSPLSGLTGVTDIALGGNSITDIGPLGELTGVTFLGVRENSIDDISAACGISPL